MILSTENFWEKRNTSEAFLSCRFYRNLLLHTSTMFHDEITWSVAADGTAPVTFQRNHNQFFSIQMESAPGPVTTNCKVLSLVPRRSAQR